MTNAAVACLDMGVIMVAISKRPPRQYVDFAHVPPSQWAIHDRLENWARWCRGSDKQAGSNASPMFELYRSSDAKRKERLYGDLTEVPVDKLDAAQIQKAMAHLPDKHRRALHWCYVHPRNPTNMARELGVDLDGLAHLIRNGRQMLVNRGV
jgi:DNA-directed RNA polymerase specialized sigma24 family protein